MVATRTRRIHVGHAPQQITARLVFDVATALEGVSIARRTLLTSTDAAHAFDAVVGTKTGQLKAAMDVAAANEGLTQFVLSHRQATAGSPASDAVVRIQRLARANNETAGAASGAAQSFVDAAIAPAKELWSPAEITSPNTGTQVGPNGQYAIHQTPLGSLQSQTAAGFAAGNLTFSTANQVIIGVKFTGMVTVTASGVTFYSCEFCGSSTTANQLVICTSGSITNVKFFDCYFNPTLKNNSNGLIGGNYTAWRCEVWRTTDGFGPRNPGSGATPNDANAYHYNCYVHDLCANLTDGGQKRNGVAPGPCHSDCCQHQGGNNMEIIGCTFRGFVDPTFGDGATWNASTATSGVSGTNNVREFGPDYQNNSCLQTNQNTGVGITSGVKVSYNDFDGGVFCINIGPGSHGDTIIDECIHNRFGHNQGGWASDGHGWTGVSSNNGGNNTFIFAPNSSTSSITSYTDNLYKDNLVAVNSRGY